MDSLEKMLTKKINEAEPTLDIFGSDRKILQVISQDLTNYLKFFSASRKEKTTRATEKSEWPMEETAEFDSFLTVWIGMWLKKWKDRVKLVLDGKSQNKAYKSAEALSKGEPLWEKLKCKQEMREILISALIRNGEICGTEILAEHALKMELGKKKDLDIDNREHLLNIMNDALRRARDMTQISGPLIFVKIDKGYYAQAAHKEIPRI